MTAEATEAARAPVEHELKSWPSEFELVLAGRKTLELRRDDRGFQVGDILVVNEWDPWSLWFTGRSCRRVVTHIVRGGQWGVAEGHVAMSMVDAKPEAEAAQAGPDEAVVAQARHVLELLTGDLCAFWACDGPDVPPVDMKTCRVCWLIFEMRQVVQAAERGCGTVVSE